MHLPRLWAREVEEWYRNYNKEIHKQRLMEVLVSPGGLPYLPQSEADRAWLV